MDALNPAILARIVANQRLLTTDYSITRETLVSDGGGGLTPSGSTTITGDCTFSERGGNTEWAPDRVQQRGSYIMKVAISADLLPTDLVVIGGRTFRVVWTPPPAADALLRTVGLEELGRGS